MINQRNNSLLLEGGDNDNGKQLHPTDDGKWEIEKKTSTIICCSEEFSGSGCFHWLIVAVLTDHPEWSLGKINNYFLEIWLLLLPTARAGNLENILVFKRFLFLWKFDILD